jgi:amino acid permease
MPLLIIGLFAISAVVMLLWNWIIPAISSLSPLTYWQAMGLFILCKILFGGFQFRRHHRGFRSIRKCHTDQHERFMEMSEEEKQQFRNQWKSRFCKPSKS